MYSKSIDIKISFYRYLHAGVNDLTRSEKAAKSVIVIIIFTLGSKLLGFLREILIAAKFGSGVETDTFFVALAATSLLSSLLNTSINTTMIPVLSEVEAKEGKQGKNNHTNNILHIIIFISLGIIISGVLLAPLLIGITAPGFKGEQFEFGVRLIRIGLPVMVFSGIAGVFRGYLQSELMFMESAASKFPFNFVYIFFLVFLSGLYGIKGLMVTSVLAVGSQILIQIPGLKKARYKYRYEFNIRDKYIKKILVLISPVLLSVSVNDLNKIVDRALASNLVAGSISALNYSNRLKTFILEVFISAITTVIFPMLSQDANEQSMESMKKVMGYGINVILIITIPATVGLVVLSKPIVRIAFERGAFDTVATSMTSGALVFYALGLVGMAMRTLLDRVYYSLQDTKTPLINGAIAVGFNIVLNLILIRFMAHRGLALATSIATIIATVLLYYGLVKRLGSLSTKKYIKCALKSLIASLAMGVVAYTVYHGIHRVTNGSFIMDLASLLVAIGLAVIVYSLLIYIFRVDEVLLVVDKLRKKISAKYSA